jgi:hypothetical protein
LRYDGVFVFVFGHGKLVSKLEASIHGKHSRESVIVRPRRALLSRGLDETNGQNLNASGIEQMAVSNGSGSRVLNVSDLELSADFRSPGGAHGVGNNWDGHRIGLY